MRINHFIAANSKLSRRAADELISKGKVFINGKVASLGQQIDPQKDHVSVRGNKITPASSPIYIAINKPVGFVSTTKDELGRPTVLDLIPKEYSHLHPIGRLDIDSEGLLLLTNDGDLTYRLTHPKHKISKTYKVLIDRSLNSKAISILENGVPLKGGKTMPAQVTRLKHDQDGYWIEITIKQGRNRQVRRMLKALNYHVYRLIRTHIGSLSLSELRGSSWRLLDDSHLQLLKQKL